MTGSTSRLPEDGERYLPWMVDPTISYEHLHRYSFARTLASGRRVLDLGSGEGYGSALLAEVGASVVGLDVDPRAVAHARSRYARPTLEFVEGSMTAVPIKGRFGLIVCFEAIEHIAEHDGLLAEVKRLLEPGGIFVVSTPDKKVYTDDSGELNPHHVKELYADEFRALIGKYFAQARWFGQRLYPGGYIFPLDAPAGGAAECLVAREGDEFAVTPAATKEARYLIAVASDGPVPVPEALPGSFLLDVSGQMVNVQAVRDLDIHLANITRTLREREQLSVETAEAHSREMQGLMEERARTAGAHARQLQDKDRLLAEAEYFIRNARNRANELERVVQEMMDSLPWRLAERGRRLLARAAPEGSTRRKLWKGSVAIAKRWLRGGARPLAVETPEDGEEVLATYWGPTEPLVAGLEYGQWILAERDDLSEIRVMIGTHGRSNTCDVDLVVKLDPADPEPLRAVRVNAYGIPDNMHCPFTFEAIADSAGKRYFVALRSPDASIGNAIAVWCRPATDRELTATINGGRKPFAWRYQCRYGDAAPEDPAGTLVAVAGLDLDSQYQIWLRQNQLRPADLERLAATQATWRYRPLISVVMPVYDVDRVWLERAIESVRAQVYPSWELCIADDASPSPHVAETIERFTALDGRIRAVRLAANRGIAGASNAALALAGGEFVALLDHDDELAPDALYEVVKLLQAYSDADVVYSDEDKVTEEGRYFAPCFKPDWSPEMFLSHMYLGHLGAYRKSLVDRLGGFREGFEGSQDYDLALRISEHTDRVFHVPKVLYHWRAIAGSTARAPGEKDHAYAAGVRALREHLGRTGVDARVEDGLWRGAYRVRRAVAGQPLVSIVIPTKDQVELLERCVHSIEERSTYRRFEILVVDNRSAEKKTLEWLAAAESSKRARVLRYPMPFNFAAINNFAVGQARGEHLVLLNNDTEVLAPEWLEALLEHSQRQEIGAVGAKLLFPDGTIQHAGVILGLGGVAGHSHRYVPGAGHGYFGAVDTIRNFSAVTFACAMIRREVYTELGGMNERELAIAFNDVDFCLRIRAAGYRIVYTPYAELYHHESASRGYDVNPNEVAYMRKTWEWELARDPYYNPNLTTIREDFSLNI
jgi:GT2 family glycosyltransferase/SAM-dependent methyltransferase